MRGGPWNLEAKKASISVVSIYSLCAIDEYMLVEDVLLDTTQLASISQQLLSNEERNHILMFGAFKCKKDVDVVGLSQVTNLAS